MYKVVNGLSPDVMQDIFETNSNYYNARNSPENINTDTNYK